MSFQEPICTICERGKEACTYCENISVLDFEAICDCGLYDFGAHFESFNCYERRDRRYVVAQSHESAGLLRESLSGRPLRAFESFQKAPRSLGEAPGSLSEPQEGSEPT